MSHTLVTALFGLTAMLGKRERDAEWHIWEDAWRGPIMRRWVNAENAWEYRDMDEAELAKYEAVSGW